MENTEETRLTKKGEFTQDIKILPKPDELYKRKIEEDRQKIFDDRGKLTKAIENIKNDIINEVENSNGRKSIPVDRMYTRGLKKLEKKVRKEAERVVHDWAKLYGYKLILDGDNDWHVIPKRKGLFGFFINQAKYHGIRCQGDTALGPLTFLGCMFGIPITIGLISCIISAVF